MLSLSTTLQLLLRHVQLLSGHETMLLQPGRGQSHSGAEPSLVVVGIAATFEFSPRIITAAEHRSSLRTPLPVLPARFEPLRPCSALRFHRTRTTMATTWHAPQLPSRSGRRGNHRVLPYQVRGHVPSLPRGETGRAAYPTHREMSTHPQGTRSLQFEEQESFRRGPGDRKRVPTSPSQRTRPATPERLRFLQEVKSKAIWSPMPEKARIYPGLARRLVSLYTAVHTNAAREASLWRESGKNCFEQEVLAASDALRDAESSCLAVASQGQRCY